MGKKRRIAPRKARKVATNQKPKAPAKSRPPIRRNEVKRIIPDSAKVVLKAVKAELSVQHRNYLTIETIRSDTTIGDLLVSFPRTREVLVRMGLRLEAEDAGDIYMTLDVFSAMNGLKTTSLMQELVEVAKEPATQQPMVQVVGTPMA